MLDLEASGGLGVTALQTWTSTWLSDGGAPHRPHADHLRVPGFWEYYLGNSAAFTRYPLWIAHYTAAAPGSPVAGPPGRSGSAPAAARVSGIGGNVDMNRFNGSTAQLAKIANTSSGGRRTGPERPHRAGRCGHRADDKGPVHHGGRPTPGKAVTFSGDLSTITPAAKVPARAVTLWARPVGSTVWSQVAAGTTDAVGHYTLGTTVANAPPTTRARTRRRVVRRLGLDGAPAGHPVRAHGRAGPAQEQGDRARGRR